MSHPTWAANPIASSNHENDSHCSPDGLKKQGFSVTYGECDSETGRMEHGSILFLGTFHDSTNLWRMSTSQRNWRVSRPGHRLTFGSGFEVSPSVAISGHIVLRPFHPARTTGTRQSMRILFV